MRMKQPWQFIEDLPDRQAAEAVRSRIDWKYILGLELTDPGFDFSVLSGRTKVNNAVLININKPETFTVPRSPFALPYSS